MLIMGIQKVKADRYSCDNPKCAVVRLGEDPTDVVGIRGQVFETSPGGGYGRDFWACSRGCLLAAITWALDSRDDES
jgi:hypothetical protein